MGLIKFGQHVWSCFSYLILGISRQHIKQSYLLNSLILAWQCRHYGAQSCLVFLGGRRLAHQGRSVGNKACYIQQTKVHCSMLTRAREHHACKHVDELITCLQAVWELVIHVAASHRKAVLVNIFNPSLKLVVPGNIIIWLVVKDDDFFDESRDGGP